jgi:hypothetical protein
MNRVFAGKATHHCGRNPFGGFTHNHHGCGGNGVCAIYHGDFQFPAKNIGLAAPVIKYTDTRTADGNSNGT